MLRRRPALRKSRRVHHLYLGIFPAMAAGAAELIRMNPPRIVLRVSWTDCRICKTMTNGCGLLMVAVDLTLHGGSADLKSVFGETNLAIADVEGGAARVITDFPGGRAWFRTHPCRGSRAKPSPGRRIGATASGNRDLSHHGAARPAPKRRRSRRRSGGLRPPCPVFSKRCATAKGFTDNRRLLECPDRARR